MLELTSAIFGENHSSSRIKKWIFLFFLSLRQQNGVTKDDRPGTNRGQDNTGVVYIQVPDYFMCTNQESLMSYLLILCTKRFLSSIKKIDQNFYRRVSSGKIYPNPIRPLSNCLKCVQVFCMSVSVQHPCRRYTVTLSYQIRKIVQIRFSCSVKRHIVSLSNKRSTFSLFPCFRETSSGQQNEGWSGDDSSRVVGSGIWQRTSSNAAPWFPSL